MFGIALKFLSNLAPNVRFYLILGIIAVILSFIGYAGLKYNSALNTIAEMKQTNTILEQQKSLLAKTNDENQLFIENIQKNIEKQEKVMSDFREQKAKDERKMANLAKAISEYDSTADGPIALVLKNTIIGIQQDREERLK